MPGSPTEGAGAPGGAPPGWYHDGLGTQRWWDGTGWTGHVDGRPGDPPPVATPDDGAGATPGPSGGYAASGPGVPPLPAAPPGSAPAPDSRLAGRRHRGRAGRAGTVAVVGGVVVAVIALVVVLAVARGGGDGGPAAERVDDRAGDPRGTDDRTAAEVVEDFTIALRTEDFVGACALYDTRRQQRLLARAGARTCDELTGGVPGVAEGAPEGVELDFEIGDVVEDGARASGAVRIVATYTGDDPAVRDSVREDPTEDVDVALVREDQGWRVTRFR